MLPTIPAKRYFTIGEVAELCEVKPHVLRYWEQEFTQLRPIKRRGNRRYYQHHEVLMIRRIRDLLYGQGFTINGARNRLQEFADEQRSRPARAGAAMAAVEPAESKAAISAALADHESAAQASAAAPISIASADAPAARPATEPSLGSASLRQELLQLRELLCAPLTPARSAPRETTGAGSV